MLCRAEDQKPAVGRSRVPGWTGSETEQGHTGARAWGSGSDLAGREPGTEFAQVLSGTEGKKPERATLSQRIPQRRCLSSVSKGEGLRWILSL